MSSHARARLPSSSWVHCMHAVRGLDGPPLALPLPLPLAGASGGGPVLSVSTSGDSSEDSVDSWTRCRGWV